ncbi:MAG: phosphate/phosphite/phosphonate ABC transporter substrate-binding protein [Chloroflexi bacterium]|nr:phosphate/phosphite/phosphonate ABC transporter substrate-binding protein [Chloroflexota bacterium]
MLNELRFTSSQAPNAFPYVKALLSHLSERLGFPVHFTEHADWLTRETQLEAGEIQVGWICGLPYVWKADIPDPSIRLLAAPVMSAARYADKPVYYSDVLVRADSAFKRFEDLRGTVWAYNEVRSQSGYNITRYHLATMQAPSGFFRKSVNAGSHQNALKLILRGSVDASAIDSTVLETERRANPNLKSALRRIAILGPSPIPPWVIHKDVPAETRAALQRELIQLDTYEEGKTLLAAGRLARFAKVQDSDYAPIREMAALAEPVKL